MNKEISNLSAHTPMMQQYGLEKCAGHVIRAFQKIDV